ncbi:MAG: hypothetical protein KTR26_11320 [Flammeovirgaceae bacterium]|nr:hypothetical protein [Flammeovirgaceae bacterium]
MVNKEKIYESFGELIFAVLRIDGIVRKEQKEKIELILNKFEFGDQVLWSFTYENNHKKKWEEIENNSLEHFLEFGPSKDYQIFFDIFEEMENEKYKLIGIKGVKMINRFKNKLRLKFSENQNINIEEDNEDWDNE